MVRVLGLSSLALLNKTLRVCYIEFKPWTVVRELRNRTFVYGIVSDIFDPLMRSLKLEYEFVRARENEFGSYIDENDTWTGVIGTLQRDEADMCVMQMFPSLERSRVVDFSSPFHFTYTAILSGKPNVVVGADYSFFKFSQVVLMSFGLSLLLLSVLISAFDQLQNRNGYLRNLYRRVMDFLSISLRQPIQFMPKSIPVNVLFSFWWMCNLFFLNIVSCYLKAKFVLRTAYVIDTLEQVIESPTVKPILTSMNFFFDFFRTATDNLYLSIWIQALVTGGVLRDAKSYSKELMAEVRSGNSLIIDVYPELMKITTENCERYAYYLGSDKFLWQANTFALSKNFDKATLEIMNVRLLQYASTKQMSRFDREQSHKMISCVWLDDDSSFANSPIAFEDFLPLLAIWIVGIVISMTMLLVEVAAPRVLNIFAKKQRQRHLRRKITPIRPTVIQDAITFNNILNDEFHHHAAKRQSIKHRTLSQ